MKYALCTMQNILNFLKKEAMLTVSVLAALVALIITPPSADLLQKIDWRTLGTLFMMLTVLEGFKKENVFEPLIKFSTHFRTMKSLVLFLVFGVFFTSMFVTNDVSLIIFVPLTITLMRQSGKEHYILPVISLENIAAVRGSMLMPFGSPQNLFLYGRFGVSAPVFILHMLPLCALSALLLVIFILNLLRHEDESLMFDGEKSIDSGITEVNEMRRRAYPVLFVLVLSVIVTRTDLWPYAVMIIALSVLMMDRNVLLKTDYVLLATFLCFFVFSSSITSNEKISLLLKDLVANNEYWWAIGISQIISNVPASIVLWPFTVNNAALIYGLDTAGLCSLIGSLASVINYRIYVRVYPG
ncbi:MAG: hypothetical protein IJ836_06730, partial [Spirochaetales bacterium]|nr:hypothetical protein [Spirochaetales bacterium]